MNPLLVNSRFPESNRQMSFPEQPSKKTIIECPEECPGKKYAQDLGYNCYGANLPNIFVFDNNVDYCRFLIRCRQKDEAFKNPKSTSTKPNLAPKRNDPLATIESG